MDDVIRSASITLLIIKDHSENILLEVEIFAANSGCTALQEYAEYECTSYNLIFLF